MSAERVRNPNTRRRVRSVTRDEHGIIVDMTLSCDHTVPARFRRTKQPFATACEKCGPSTPQSIEGWPEGTRLSCRLCGILLCAGHGDPRPERKIECLACLEVALT